MVDLADGASIDITMPGYVASIDELTGAAGPPGADGVGVPAGGTTGQVLSKVNGTDYNTTWTTNGTGDVSGPASAVDNRFAAFDSTTGKLIKDSGSSAATFASAAQGSTADTTASGLAAHIADTTDAHDASAISSVAAGTLAATDVQAALNELDTEKATTGSVSTVAGDLAAHISDASDAHDASAISFAPTGTIAASDVQAAIAEVAVEAKVATSLTSGLVDTARLGSGTASVATVLHGDQTYKVPSGTILDYAVWTNGGVDTTLTLTGNAATLVTIDAALQVSFVAPAVAVKVEMCATFKGEDAGSGNWWGLLASGTPVAGSTAAMGGPTVGNGWARRTHLAIIIGLTPGNTYTWDWAWAGNEDAVSELNVGSGAPSVAEEFGPMAITVTAL